MLEDGRANVLVRIFLTVNGSKKVFGGCLVFAKIDAGNGKVKSIKRAVSVIEAISHDLIESSLTLREQNQVGARARDDSIL